MVRLLPDRLTQPRAGWFPPELQMYHLLRLRTVKGAIGLLRRLDVRHKRRMTRAYAA
jgi:hypothetical protein